MSKTIKKVYTSGPISGLEPDVFKKNFGDTALWLQDLGYEVVNPVEVVPDCDRTCLEIDEYIVPSGQYEHTWQCYVKADIKAMFDCDAIYMLAGWKQSRGANLERRIAAGLGLAELYVTNDNLLAWRDIKFTPTMTDLQQSINAWAVRKEWRGPKATPRPLVADLMLFVSEAAEALEELRKNADPTFYYESYTVEHNGVKFKDLSAEQVRALGHDPQGLVGKPEGFGPEVADLVIRVLETMEEYGLNLDFEVDRKMTYNEGREIRHGGLLM